MDVRALAQLSFSVPSYEMAMEWQKEKKHDTALLNTRECKNTRATRQQEKLKLKQNSIDKVIIRGDSGCKKSKLDCSAEEWKRENFNKLRKFE